MVISATRLLVFAVKEGVELCILCDSGPSLVDIEMTIENYWSGVSDALKGSVLIFTYSGTPLIRTPIGQNKVSVLERCRYFRG